MILDREGEVGAAMVFYEKAYNKEISLAGNSQTQSSLIKSATNLTVCYEKMGMRDKALKVFEELPKLTDQKLNNNMGVILKRECLYERSMDCYE